METGSYDEMFEDTMGAPGSGGARPHAQVHLLSPTDKCKVRVVLEMNDKFIFQ